MGILKNEKTGQLIALGVRCLVGRGPRADLKIESDTVSQEHASIYFHRDRWTARDLGSRNGTSLNRNTFKSGESRELSRGDSLVFASHPDAFTLVDAGVPGPAAHSEEGALVVGQAGELWLTDEVQPEGYVYLNGGHWLIEQHCTQKPVASGDRVAVRNEMWTLLLPDLHLDEIASLDPPTTALTDPTGFGLNFKVGGAEEHIELEARVAGQVISLGARSHNYPLLLLARRRIEEDGKEIPEAEVGWIYTDELARMTGADRKHLNLLLWRAQRAVKAAGVSTSGLVERRTDSRQLRLGVPNCTVTVA